MTDDVGVKKPKKRLHSLADLAHFLCTQEVEIEEVQEGEVSVGGKGDRRQL